MASDPINKPSLVSCRSLARGYQPRTPEDEAAQVARLLRYFEEGEPQLVPIIVHKGKIVDGHCRWMAKMQQGKKVLAIEWHGDKPPTEAEVRAINSTQAAIPAVVKIERAERQLAKGRTLEEVAAEEGASPEKLKRKIANKRKVQEAGTLELATASQAAIDKEAARLTKEADKAKAGTVDAKGRERKGNASEARAGVAHASIPVRRGGGRTGKAGGGEGEEAAPKADHRDARIADLEGQLDKAKARIAALEKDKARLLQEVREAEEGEKKARATMASILGED